MNIALFLGIQNPNAQSIIDDAFNKCHEVSDGHKFVPDRDFGTIKKSEILEMIIDDMSNRVLTLHKERT